MDSLIEKPYGFELILDIHDANAARFNRLDISIFMNELCEKIDMVAENLHFWDDLDVAEEDRQTEPHTKGTSAVQFILTSTIVLHTLDDLKRVYLNIFSCKEFDPVAAKKYVLEYFGGRALIEHFITRI